MSALLALRSRALFTAAVAFAALTVPLAVPAHADAGQATDVATAPLTEARIDAANSGEPQEVTDLTTETSKVMAQPDGSLVLTSSLTPVRTRKDGDWVDVDPRLHRDSDGSLRPEAVIDDVAFSGGGTGPAVRVAHDDTSLDLSWPTPLPSPRIDGASAVYASVLPGVDLVLTARADSYNEVLVVHDRAAAQNPALDHLTLRVRADNLRLSQNPEGGLTATDDAGQEQFHGSAPVMWDSSHANGTPVPTASDPSTGRITVVPTSVPVADGTDTPASSTITLQPPVGALDGSNVEYPVYIDPPLAPNRSHFAVVTTQNNWHYYDDTSNDLKVGYCAWVECNGSFKARTFLSFNTDALGDQPTNAQVYSAKVQVYEIHSAHDCTPEDVDLYSSGSINSSTDWPGPSGSALDSASSKLGNTCNDTAGMVTFDGAKVVDYFQDAADHDTNTLTFGVRSPDESDRYKWKRFSSAGGSSSSAAQIEVHYDFPPSVPSGLTVDNTVACSGNPVYLRDTTPTVHAHANDYNTPHLPVSMHFVIQNTAATTNRHNPAGVVVSSGALASWTSNSSNTSSTQPLPDDRYGVRAYATSSSSDTPDEAGSSTPWSYFTVDHTAPAAPGISSFDYPRNMWGTVPGGRFTLTSSADVAGFAYSFDGSGTEPLPVDSTCSYTTTPTASGGRVTATDGSASFTLPALSVGYHTLYAKAFDDAHNVSAETSAYVFYVAPTIADEGYTRHEGESFTVSATGDACDAGNCATYTGASNSWSGAKALDLVADRGSEAAPTTFKTTPFSINVAAEYAVDARVATQNHFGIIEFALDDKILTNDGSPIKVDTYSPTFGSLDVALGGRHLEPGQHTLSFLLVGTNPSSVNYPYKSSYGSPAVPIGSAAAPLNDNGYSAVIDYVRVVAVNDATYTSFAAARNNNAIAIGNSSQADIGPATNHVGMDQTAMSSAGFAPNSDVTVDNGTQTQTTFHLDSFNGDDNVVAMGQTIPLPRDVNAANIDLLVNETCKLASYKPSIQLTVNFADGRYSSTLMPAVPGWANVTTMPAPVDGQEASQTLVMTNDHITRGNGVDSGTHPQLFHVSIPTKSDGSSPVHSITLPYLGSDLSERCDAPNLHVYAISTHGTPGA